MNQGSLALDIGRLAGGYGMGAFSYVVCMFCNFMQLQLVYTDLLAIMNNGKINRYLFTLRK